MPPFVPQSSCCSGNRERGCHDLLNSRCIDTVSTPSRTTHTWGNYSLLALLLLACSECILAINPDTHTYTHTSPTSACNANTFSSNTGRGCPHPVLSPHQEERKRTAAQEVGTLTPCHLLHRYNHLLSALWRNSCSRSTALWTHTKFIFQATCPSSGNRINIGRAY